MKIAGIILIIAQILALIGRGIFCAVSGSPFFQSVPQAFGFFIFGIIGVILLIVHANKKK